MLKSLGVTKKIMINLTLTTKISDLN
jgi:hypothetical protein